MRVAGGRGARVAVLLALAASAYQLAAWAVAPGFYDGIAPVQPYRWISPPPEFRAGNQSPTSGRATIRLANGGQVDAGNASTQDGQASLSFQQGTFAAPADRSSVTIDIAPQTTSPAPGSIHLATNVYCFSSNSTIASGKSALVTLRFSTQITAPTDVYVYQGSGPWRKIGNAGAAAPYFIAADTSSLGCFAGGYDNASAVAKTSGSSTTLPIVAGLAVAVVLLAGIPLLVLRRRGEEEEDAE